MIRKSMAALAVAMIASTASVEAEPFVSDFAFVMSTQWFLLPGPPDKDRQLQFRRFSVALHKADFDAVRSGTTSRVQIIGEAGTFYNSMIYTCQGDRGKSDFLTLHFPANVAPASFAFGEWRPRLDVSILADRASSNFVGEYNKGDIFVDASTVGVDTFLGFANAAALTLDFGEKHDRLNLFVADRFANMDLAAGTREMLPLSLNIKPNALRSFSSREMVERCLQYKKSGRS
jgi:hypothetical protein